VGIADGADIHAQQLELGRHVGAGERDRRLPISNAARLRAMP
jgi:hypothetical protein